MLHPILKTLNTGEYHRQSAHQGILSPSTALKWQKSCLYSLHSLLHCENKTYTTLCPQKKLQVCFLAISQLLLGQIQNVRSVLKTTGSENFKTVLTFEIRPSRS